MRCKTIKKLVVGSIGILVVICLYFGISSGTERVVISNEESKQLMNTNALTMMYKIEAGSGEYQVTSDTTWPQEGYVFNDRLSKCENGSELSWDDENKRVIVSTSVSDKCYVYFNVYAPIFSDYIINDIYTEDGENGLYYHDEVGTYGTLEAGDGSYRYAGANPNNYVCFGSDATSCPADNLYRIIGVFDGQVKLIKYDYAGESTLGTAPARIVTPNSSYYKGSLSNIPNYYWSGSSSNDSNTWSSSTLNTDILNGTYLNTLGSEWTSKIATTSWKVGGNTYSNITQNATPKIAYTNEIESPVENTTYSAKIGLMYVSEYGYAASPENWNTTLYNYDNDTNRNNNWMYMGAYEWTISRSSDYGNDAFRVNVDGGVDDYGVYNYYGVRPSFSLESSVVLSGGSGTSAYPFRVN